MQALLVGGTVAATTAVGAADALEASLRASLDAGALSMVGVDAAASADVLATATAVVDTALLTS